jgi:hypothetical protein
MRLDVETLHDRQTEYIYSVEGATETDIKICDDFAKGVSITSLSLKYQWSERTIRRIIHRVKVFLSDPPKTLSIENFYLS